MIEGLTEKNLLSVLAAIQGLSPAHSGQFVRDSDIAKETGFSTQEVQDYLELLEEQDKVLLSKSLGPAYQAHLKPKGRIALRDPSFGASKSPSSILVQGNKGVIVNVDSQINSSTQSTTRPSSESEEGGLFDARIESTPSFTLHDFHFYPEDAYGEPKSGPRYPKAAKKALQTTIAFTIASSSSTPVFIQNVFVHVLESRAFKQSTFPAYERGGNGITPVLGWVELSSELKKYRAITNVKRKVGKGLEPADFHIRTFCHSGQKFKLALEIEWMDLARQEKTHRFVFPEEVKIELPEMFEWEKIVKRSSSLRIGIPLVDAGFLLGDLKKIGVSAKVKILAPASTESDADFYSTLIDSAGLSDGTGQYIFFSSEEDMKAIVPHQKDDEENEEEAYEDRGRSFIIVNERVMLVENHRGDFLADVIEDEGLVKKAIEAFDSVFNHLAS